LRGRAGTGPTSSALKRAIDVAVSGSLLLVLAPVIGLVAIGIALESRGGAFYRSRRVGKGGHEFDMLKFRKMGRSAAGPALTAPVDDRFTRVGRFLAHTKLDELPQLWNVLRGQMSLVGPRPEDPHFVRLYPEAFTIVLRAKPGITGLSQLAFARESEILDASDRIGDYVRRLLPAKLRLDRLYVERRTTSMDLAILVWTGAAVLLRRMVAVHRSTGHLTLRKPRAVPVAAVQQEVLG
jgi:lipopolysaccharide/colanic/teichoic acid biosynthesis glycosyltransferase